MRYVSGSDYDPVWDAQDQRRRKTTLQSRTRRNALRNWKRRAQEATQ